MPLPVVVEHSVRQLRLIYDAFIRERAESKLMDLQNLQTSAIYGATGKPAGVNALTKDLARQMAVGAPKAPDLKANRAAHLARLKAMGAGQR